MVGLSGLCNRLHNWKRIQAREETGMQTRRLLLAFLVGAAAALPGQAARADAADTYPSQVVRFIVPFAAGSNTDMLARTISDKLSPIWHQQVIVENRPGLAGTAYAAKTAADGHTLLLTSNGHTILGKINANLPFDPVKDFAGVTQVASMPLILIVPPDSPAKTLKELIALAQANPGKLNYASAGLGSTANIASVLFKQVANVDMVHVPYKGTPEAQTSIMRGDAAMFFTPAAVGQDLIQTNKVRALAVSSAKRLPGLPDVPTFAEAGLPSFVYDAWFGILAPAGTPPAILQKASQDIGKVLAMPDVRELLATQGVTTVSTTPDAFGELVKADTVRFSALLGDAQK
jgi:tripartite-type tricarboxylate transporter receptor subunit TctC